MSAWYACRPDTQSRPATEVVEPICEEVLRGQRSKTPRSPMSVGEFTMAVARLGDPTNRG